MPQFDSSAFWGIAGIVVGLIVSIAFFFIGRKRVLLEYDVISTELIANKTSCVPGLDITFRGEVVSDLTMSKVKIYNHGNCEISPLDFDSHNLLRLTPTGRLFFSQTDSVPSHTEYITEFFRSDNTLFILLYLPPKESLTITVFHSGEISVLGELRTGLLQKYYTIFERTVVKINKVLGMAFLTSIIAGVISSAIFAIICLIGHALLKIVLGYFGISI